MTKEIRADTANLYFSHIEINLDAQFGNVMRHDITNFLTSSDHYVDLGRCAAET